MLIQESEAAFPIVGDQDPETCPFKCDLYQRPYGFFVVISKSFPTV
jgi:hypothetical protein